MALSGIISSIAGAITSAISWFFSVLPLPLRVFFFLFFIMFVVTSTLGFFLGFWYSCDSSGTAYEMSSLTLTAQEEFVDWGLESCGDVVNENSTGWVFFGSFMEMGERLYNWVFDVEAKCDRFRDQTDLNIITRDEILQTMSEPVESDQGMTIGCILPEGSTVYVPTLTWYGMNVLDKRIWLLGSILMLLMPFAFAWYGVIFKD